MKSQAIKRLLDAAQAIDAIERFTRGETLDTYLKSELLQAAVGQCILWDAIHEDISQLKNELDALITEG